MSSRSPQSVTVGGTERIGERLLAVRLWMVAAVLGLLVVAVALVWWIASPSEPPGEPHGADAAASARTLTPTPTEMPTELPPAPTATITNIVLEATPVPSKVDQSKSTIPLPTVTPTRVVEDVSPHDVELSGATTLRMSLVSRGFESTGRPLRFAIDSRTHVLDGSFLSLSDRWCKQLGLANLVFDLAVDLDPRTEALRVTGTISLNSDFCDQPGEVLDTVDVDFAVPTDASAQIAYSLYGERKFLGMTELLNTDIGVIVELVVTNSRPR